MVYSLGLHILHLEASLLFVHLILDSFFIPLYFSAYLFVLVGVKICFKSLFFF